MVYNTFSREDVDNTIIFSNESPLKTVDRILTFADNASGSFKKREVRWSFNAEYWSSWQVITPNVVTGINVNNNPYLYLQFRYTLNSANSGTVTTITINYTTTNIGQIPLPVYPDVSIDHAHPLPDYHEVVVINSEKTYQNADLLQGKNGAYYLNRSNHTGSQGINTINGLTNTLLSLDHGLTNLFIYTDGSLYIRDASILELRNQLGSYASVAYVDGSLALRDASISELLGMFADYATLVYTDGSLALRDASISAIIGDLTNYSTLSYVDSSLSERDA